MTVDWEQVLELLQRWHSARSHLAARLAIAFLESQLRLVIPPAARRQWPEADVEDALRSYLARLLEQPLPSVPAHPRAYFVTAFRNHCIDLERQRRRAPLSAVQGDGLPEPRYEPDPLAGRAAAEEAERIRGALAQLPLPDRVALMLVDAPEWLAPSELSWLSTQCGRAVEEIRTILDRSPSMYELTLLFDGTPDEEPGEKGRRLRMERFRRRRGRARDKVRALLEGGTP